MRQAILFLYFSNVIIATAAAALLWQVQIQLHPAFINNNLLVWAAVACFTFYNLHDFYTKVVALQSLSTPRQQFWQRFWPALLILNAAVIAVCSLFVSLPLSAAQWQVIGIAVLLSLTYSFPVLPFAHMKRWKNNGIWKICMLAFVWAFFCSFFVLMSWKDYQPSLGLLVFFRLCFVLMITIPFDNRDAAIDQTYMQRSLLQVWSPQALKNIILLLGIVGAVALCVYQINMQLPIYFLVAHMFYWCLLVWWSLQALHQPKAPLRFLWLDVQLILQPTFLGIGLLDTYIRST